MAILRGEAARKWLEENKGKDYRDLNTGKIISGQRSGVANLLLGMSKPFRMVGGLGQEAMMGLANAAARSRGQKQYYNKEDRPLSNVLLTGAETEEMREDPLLAAGKSAAGIASYFMPVGAAAKAVGAGAKIGSAALRGAGAGALGGFGYSEKGEELGGALKGAALGGLLGGGLQAAGEIGTKLATPKSGVAAGEYTVDDIAKFPESLKKNLRKQAKSAKLWDTTLGDTENLQFFLAHRELAGSTARETAENIVKEIERGKLLKKTGIGEIGQVGDDVFVTAKQNFENAIDLSGLSDKIRKTSDYKIIDKYLSGKAGVTGAEELDRIIMKWQDIGRKASGEVKDTIAAAAYTEGAKALRDSMRIIPKGANYDAGLKILDNLSSVEKTGLVPKGLKGTQSAGFHPPFSAGANVSASPVVEILDRTRAALGRTGERGLYSPTIGGALERAPSLLRKGVVPGIIGAGAQSGQEQVPLGTQGIAEQVAQPQYSFPDAIAEAYSYFPNASEAQIITVAKYLMDQKGGGDVDSSTIANVQQAIDMIDQYGSSAAGKIPFITGKIGEFFGGASEGTTYRSLISDIRTKLIKQIAGTAQTPAEMKNLMDRLPQPTDEPAVARAKLQVLLNSLQGGGSMQPTEQQLSDQYNSY